MKNLLLAASLFTFFTVSAQEYSSGTIQIGMVVKDMDRTVKFYTEVLGLVEAGGFPISEDFGKKSGLSNGVPFDVKILKLINEEAATQLKLVTFKKDPTHQTPSYIQDDNGVQYITFYVKSITPLLERIKKNNVKLLGETPTPLPGDRMFIMVQDPDGTFVEIIGGA